MATGDREVRVRTGLVIPAADLEIRFSRSGGPGGQNVNKVETRVEVRFDLASTKLFRPEEKARALSVLATRLAGEGVLIVLCDRTRHRERNLREALFKMGELLREAIIPPKKRYRTRPTRGSRERRLDVKRKRAEVKKGRRERPEA